MVSKAKSGIIISKLMIILLILPLTVGQLFMSTTASATTYTLTEARAQITNCLASVNDPDITQSTLPSILRGTKSIYPDIASVETAVQNGDLRIQIATGSGVFGILDNSQSDLYCGNSQDNTVTVLDAAAGKYDYFFGGAGNDTVNQMVSVFWHTR